MNKKVLMIIVALLAVAVLATPLLGTAEACGFRRIWRRWRRPTFCGREMNVTDMGDYTEYVGTLGGANFVIRIPEDWNGMLVVGCHGYRMNWDPDAQFLVDNYKNSEGIGLPFKLVEQGFAYAASSYGEGGWAVKKGMISTLQLTIFSLGMLRWQFRCCHDIKVFLVGGSMGGAIVLLLGEKYPRIYDGVLDICGVKNMTDYYIRAVAIINSPIFPSLPPGVQAAALQLKADIEAEFGGTYDEKPKAYERLSPTSNVDITIPVISVHGALDTAIPLPHALSYGIAVAQAGRSEYYREYTVADGGHVNSPPVIDEALIRFDKLVDYPVGW